MTMIGKTEGTVILTVHAKREAQVNQVYPEKDKNKLNVALSAAGSRAMRPRLADYVLVDAARRADHVVSEGYRLWLFSSATSAPACACLSPAGSGALSVNLLDAVGERGHLTTIELRPEPASGLGQMPRHGARPPAGGTSKPATSIPLPPNCLSIVDRIMPDMLDPWNRPEQAYRVIVPAACWSVT